MTDGTPQRAVHEPWFTVLAWAFVLLLLLAGGLISWFLVPRPHTFDDGLKLLTTAIGIPSFVAIAFYGRLSIELTGVLLAVILGFVFGSILH